MSVNALQGIRERFGRTLVMVGATDILFLSLSTDPNCYNILHQQKFSYTCHNLITLYASNIRAKFDKYNICQTGERND
jgi:hypothetical protein